MKTSTLLLLVGLGGLIWWTRRPRSAATPQPGTAALPGITPVIPTPAEVALTSSSTDGQSFTAGTYPGVAAAPGGFDPNNPLGLGSWLA